MKKYYIQPRATQIGLFAEENVLNATSTEGTLGFDPEDSTEDDLGWSKKKEERYGFGSFDWE